MPAKRFSIQKYSDSLTAISYSKKSVGVPHDHNLVRNKKVLGNLSMELRHELFGFLFLDSRKQEQKSKSEKNRPFIDSIWKGLLLVDL